MTTYPEGGLNAELAARYREVLARYGINLKLVPSAGAIESLACLRDPSRRLVDPNAYIRVADSWQVGIS
jgi:hypothetical protein